MSSAAICRVYVVAASILPVGKPDGECWVCKSPLADHGKQVSSLVPPGQVFVVDEQAIMGDGDDKPEDDYSNVSRWP